MLGDTLAAFSMPLSLDLVTGMLNRHLRVVQLIMIVYIACNPLCKWCVRERRRETCLTKAQVLCMLEVAYFSQ